tara:strand:- start:3726 stop:3980 length:255 start_codon:yes stop_codon:yes gene_type:complete
MKNFFTNLLINIIKVYKFLLSPILGNNCRFNKSCSDYFIDCLKYHGILKGIFFGFKRILSCHPYGNVNENEHLDLITKKGNKNG